MQVDVILEFDGKRMIVRGVFQTDQRHLVIPLPGNVQSIVRIEIDDVADVTALTGLMRSDEPMKVTGPSNSALTVIR